MNNEKEQTNLLEEIGEESNKVKKWFKDNISIFAILVICVVYVVYGLVHIKETGKTILEIVAGGFISFIMGFLIKSLFNAQGVSNGENSKLFKATKELYGKSIEEVDDFLQYLPKYCDIKNEQLLKDAQSNILRTKNLKYEKFNNEYYFQEDIYKKLSKDEKNCLQKAKNIKIHFLNDTILLSDCQLTLDVGKDLTTNKNQYLRKSNTSTMIMMIASAILFGYFTPTAEVDWTGAIWSLIQVAWFLGIGVMQYFKGYNYMTDKYRTAIIRKSNYLKEFKNMFKANPNKFKEDEKEEPQVVILENAKPEKTDTMLLKETETTNQVNVEKSLETKLEPLKEEIKEDKPIKSFEELIIEENKKLKEENQKLKEDKVQSFEDFRTQMLERNRKISGN